MSNFVVSARKYRPQRFEDVVGQEHVSQTLKNALQTDHLAHAFLFCGPRGVGKTTCARILAKIINCENKTDNLEACNTCSSCKSLNENASFNITELDAASNNSVDHIRALVEQVRFQPQQGAYKIYIIDEVHMLSSQAFNAFLKTLEEPPPYAIFILATTEKHKIIPTILSRCQIFDFKRIQIPAMVEHLECICQEEEIEAEKDALHIIAQKADGALRDALSIFDRVVSFSGKKIHYEDVITNLNVLDYDYFFQVVEAILQSDVSKMLLIFDEILKNGFEEAVFINGLAAHLRNLLVCKDISTIPLLEVGDNLQKKYATQAKITPHALLLTALNLTNECDIHYKTARNKRLHVEMTIIKMCYINQALKSNENTIKLEKKKTIDDKIEANPKSDNVAPPPSIQKSEAKKTSNAKELKVSSGSLAKSSILLSKLKATDKFGSVSIGSLSDLDHQIKKSEKNTPIKKTTTLAEIQTAWDNYTETRESNFSKNLLKNTALRLDGHVITAIVTSKMSESGLRDERDLMAYIRQEIGMPKLILQIKVDESKAPKIDPVAKPLSKKEIYEQMVQQNPLVDKLRVTLDLTGDNH